MRTGGIVKSLFFRLRLLKSPPPVRAVGNAPSRIASDIYTPAAGNSSLNGSIQPSLQILGVYYSSLINSGKKIEIELDRDKIEFCWKGIEKATFSISVENSVEKKTFLSPPLSQGESFDINDPQILKPNISFSIQIKSSNNTPLGSVDFRLIVVEKLTIIKDAAKKEMARISIPHGWLANTFWHFLKPSPMQTFKAATRAMLALKRSSKVPELSGKDIAQAIYSIESLREWLLSIDPKKTAKILDNLQKEAKRCDIGEWGEIKREFGRLLVFSTNKDTVGGKLF